MAIRGSAFLENLALAHAPIRGWLVVAFPISVWFVVEKWIERRVRFSIALLHGQVGDVILTPRSTRILSLVPMCPTRSSGERFHVRTRGGLRQPLV